MEFLPSMIIGTSGHIDHGKTSLVRALTGVDTDRLKEEKARGISIELGYAYTALPGGEVLGFVDVPGHQRLVHTMVAGVRGIDYALLVIAADDGVMPQTREHLAILELLGLKHGAVALTKIDRVDSARIPAVSAEIRALLAPTALSQAPIFPLAATAQDEPGVAALRAHLQSAAADWPSIPSDGLFRLAVDRVFTLPGRGTVATGTACAGRVAIGDTLAVMPAGKLVRVRSIHAQNRETGVGLAGQRCALNLVGIEKTAMTRGDWLADPKALVASTRIDARLRKLDGANFSSRAPLHVHLGTAHRVARVVPLEGGALPVASARVQLIFDAPICAAPGEPFVVRDAQAQHTIGGGIVIDPCAPARRRRSPERLAYLDSLERCAAGEGVAPLLRHAPQGIGMRDLVRLCGRSEERIQLAPQTRIVDLKGERLVILESHWRAMSEGALEVLSRFHAQQPEEPGIDRGRLRRMTQPTLSDSAWRVLIDDLVRRQAINAHGTMAAFAGTPHHLEHTRIRARPQARCRDIRGSLRPALGARSCQKPCRRPRMRSGGCCGNAPYRELYSRSSTIFFIIAIPCANWLKSSNVSCMVMTASKRPGSGMPSAWAASAPFRFWNSSIALAILAARAIRVCCAPTAVGTKKMAAMRRLARIRKARVSGDAAGLQTRWGTSSVSR